jgi:hypothetical protein
VLALESLVSAGAVPVTSVAAAPSLLRAVLGVCAAPLPPVPCAEDGLWLRRSDLWRASAALTRRLAPAPMPLTLSVLDAGAAPPMDSSTRRLLGAAGEGDHAASMQDAYVVSGAGFTPANGVYSREGEYGGTAKYVHEKGQIWMIRYTLPSGNQYWYLADKDNLDRDTGDYYRIKCAEGRPPLGEWEKAKDGVLPCATIARHRSAVLGPSESLLVLRRPAHEPRSPCGLELRWAQEQAATRHGAQAMVVQVVAVRQPALAPARRAARRARPRGPHGRPSSWG